MTESTFFNIEFFKTLISVLIGGVISLSSVLIVEFIKNKRQKKEDKKKLYVDLISTINQMRRIEIYSLQTSLTFNFHRRNFEINENDISKQQAEYNLNLSNEYNDKLTEKAQKLDSLCLEYQIFYEKDNKFNEVVNDLNNWPRPNSPNFSNINTVLELNSKFSKDFKSLTKFTSDFWTSSAEKINNQIKKNLI
ncbi:hypothetical protein [Polaribacter porphyrae]|uniref:LemA family protein n=1 Tax=Polaribacter porphyrae TaxID=1137780 RepID=A0A2S7WQK5_9FLAO|nr:hypothetical protein [Polaribacter porphyrae]PQJ79592.1 hypothetical protein BTO18_10595 [Polaribacter porphyrae]